MEQYVKQFKEYVLKFLKGRAKQFGVPMHKISLCFFLGMSTDNVNIGAGYYVAKGVINRYVIKKLHEGEAIFFEAVKNEESGKYDYSWTFKPNEKVAEYGSEEDAKAVIEAFGFKDAEPLYIGDFSDYYKWIETYPEPQKVEKVDFEVLEGVTIDDIIDVKIDFLNKKQTFHGIIYQSLFYVAGANNIEQTNTKVYAIPDEEGKDITLYIFDGETYRSVIEIDDLVMGAFAQQEQQA